MIERVEGQEKGRNQGTEMQAKCQQQKDGEGIRVLEN